MKIYLLGVAAGEQGCFGPGWSEVPDELGKQLLAGGAATKTEPKTGGEPVEPATVEPVEPDDDDDDEPTHKARKIGRR